MGFELLTQPQVFLAPITAVGGIQNGLFNDPLPPLYTSFYTWTSTASITATTFPLGGIETLTNRSGSYIVTVGGVVQAPSNYTVDPNTRLLTFDFNVNPDTPVVITQIGTLGSLLSAENLTATNSFLENVTATRLTVLTSTILETIYIPTSVVNLTAINTAQFLNSILVTGNISATNTVFASGGNSNLWNYNTTLLQTNSANWESTYATVCSLSSFWEESVDITAITTVVASNSANWDTAYATTTALSSNLWNDVYTTVQSNSAFWDYQGTDIKALTANWESTYVTVCSLSASWEESADITVLSTIVESNSANWDTAYITTTSLSSNLWNDVYTTVQSSSASWEESADILPTVTNYLSTSNVLLSGLTTESITITSNEVFGTTSYVNTVSALAITVNGTVLYLPLLSAI